MASPNTHREALMAEKLRKTVDESTAAVNESSVALSRSIDRQTKDAVKSVQEAPERRAGQRGVPAVASDGLFWWSF